jgi:hypothetical protein
MTGRRCGKEKRFLPMLAPAADEPEGKDSHRSADGVDAHVGDVSGARGNEGLMDLISRRVECDDENGEEGMFAVPRARITPDRFAQGAPEKEGQHRVFRQVSAFADDENDAVLGIIGHVRKKPMENGPDDARRVLIGSAVAGGGEDEAHPDNDRQPIKQKGTRTRHGATRNWVLRWKPMEKSVKP